MTNLSDNQVAYDKKMQKNRLFIWFFRIFFFLLFILLWELSTRCKWVDAFIFSSPSRMITTFQHMWSDNQLYLHIGVTIAETLISFSIVILLGILCAVLLWIFPRISDIFEPYLVILNSLPKSALAPLLIVWLGTNMKTIIVAGISVAIFGTIMHLHTAFSETDQDKIKLISTLGGTRYQILTKVVLPCAIPHMISLLKVNIGLCLVGVIIGEFIGSRQGLGHLIIYGTQVFKLDWVVLSIIILCFVAVVLYGIIGFIEKLFQKERSS